MRFGTACRTTPRACAGELSPPVWKATPDWDDLDKAGRFYRISKADAVRHCGRAMVERRKADPFLSVDELLDGHGRG